MIGAFIGGAIIGGLINGGVGNGYGQPYNGGRFYIGPGGYRGYYYTGQVPMGARVGAFLVRIPVVGGFNICWWPYYIISVPTYYGPYNGGGFYYVTEVPPIEETSAWSQPPQPGGFLPPNKCYAPEVADGNMIPDLGRPVPCP